jgi:hypothetical protein
MQNQIINVHPPNNICKNCKYFKPNPFWIKMEHRLHYGSCLHPCSQKLNVVTGHVEYEDARHMRLYDTKCGPNGKHYEEETNTFKLSFRHRNLWDGIGIWLLAVLIFLFFQV